MSTHPLPASATAHLGADAGYQPLPKLWSVVAVAEALSVCRGSIYNFIDAGILPPPKKMGRRSVWSTADVQAAVDRILTGEAA